MLTIHYDLIGTHPEMDPHEHLFKNVVDRALTGDLDAQVIAVKGAAHWYGLSLDDFDSVIDLIDAMAGVDQELEVR